MEASAIKQEDAGELKSSVATWSNFPAGLRVLVVDDDPLCLKIIAQMLKRCDYEVCTCVNAASALEQLRDKTHNFDLVLSDVYMPDMDGFKLLEAIGLELDLPVIMMSANGEHTTVMRGVTHGACDFLIKPHQQQLRDVENEDVPADMDTDHSRKRKDICREGSFNADRDDDGGASKKPRVVWSVEMHQQFVQAVNQLGIDSEWPGSDVLMGLHMSLLNSLMQQNINPMNPMNHMGSMMAAALGQMGMPGVPGLTGLGPMAAGLGQAAAAAAAAAAGGQLLPGMGPLAGMPPLAGPLGMPAGPLGPLGAMNLQQQGLPGPLPGMALGGMGQVPPGLRPPGMGEHVG
eukprot:gene11505-11648_t